jgi:hypothetical protein
MGSAMENASYRHKDYLLAGLLGAIGGGLAVALVTRAIPTMVSRIVAGMMQTMMAQMGGECGASPQEV